MFSWAVPERFVDPPDGRMVAVGFGTGEAHEAALTRTVRMIGSAGRAIIEAIAWTGAPMLVIGVPIMSLPVIENVQSRIRARRFANAAARGDLRRAERAARRFFDVS